MTAYYKAPPKPVAKRKKTILHQEYDGSWTTHTASMVFPSTMSERDLWEQLQAALKEIEELKKAAAPVAEVAHG
jgi:hypothetical protein